MTGSFTSDIGSTARFATAALWDRCGFFKMETRFQCVSRIILSLFFGTAIVLGNSVAKADPVSEMASFSAFGSVDLQQLAKTDVKTAHGPPMNNPRFLSVQSCYVVPRPPAQEIEALRRWNPTTHRELKVYLHSDLPGSATPESFAPLRSAPDNDALRSLVNKTKKLSPDLQISKEEAKKFTPSNDTGGSISPSIASFWMNILSGRARAFASGGTAAQPPYDHNGQAVRPNEELNGLLREQGKIRQQFSAFLGSTGIGRGAAGKPEKYWELLSADDEGVVTLGASYNRGGTGGTYQAADTLYYASGGFYVTLTLFQLWPVAVDGKASTLVWRGDFVSAAKLATLHGVERLASESAMMKDITKAVTLYRRDTSSGR
jgi:hypothetical protein